MLDSLKYKRTISSSSNESFCMVHLIHYFRSEVRTCKKYFLIFVLCPVFVLSKIGFPATFLNKHTIILVWLLEKFSALNMINYAPYQGILNKKILQHKVLVVPMELMNINSRRNLRLQLTPLQKRSYPYISNGYIVVPQPAEVGRALRLGGAHHPKLQLFWRRP